MSLKLDEQNWELMTEWADGEHSCSDSGTRRTTFVKLHSLWHVAKTKLWISFPRLRSQRDQRQRLIWLTTLKSLVISISRVPSSGTKQMFEGSIPPAIRYRVVSIERDLPLKVMPAIASCCAIAKGTDTRIQAGALPYTENRMRTYRPHSEETAAVWQSFLALYNTIGSSAPQPAAGFVVLWVR